MRKNILESELIKRIQNGELEAFNPIATRYRPQVLGLILKSGLQNDLACAEDILQDSFLKALDSIQKGNYNHTNNLQQWIQRIAFHRTMDYHRSKYRIPSLSTSSGETSSSTNTDHETGGRINKVFLLPGHEASPEETLIRNELIQILNSINFDIRQTIFSMFDKLPKDQGEILILRYFFKLPFKEIAQIEEISLNTALGRVRYALLNMRKLLIGVPEHILEGLRLEIE